MVAKISEHTQSEIMGKTWFWSWFLIVMDKIYKEKMEKQIDNSYFILALFVQY